MCGNCNSNDNSICDLILLLLLLFCLFDGNGYGEILGDLIGPESNNLPDSRNGCGCGCGCCGCGCRCC